MCKSIFPSPFVRVIIPCPAQSTFFFEIAIHLPKMKRHDPPYVKNAQKSFVFSLLFVYFVGFSLYMMIDDQSRVYLMMIDPVLNFLKINWKSISEKKKSSPTSPN